MMLDGFLNKTSLTLAAIIVGIYLAFVLSRLFRQKSSYEMEIEQVLTSENNKVKGRFE